jgi:hypothetical protein
MSISRNSAGGARAQDIAADVNAFWENQSFHNYADYALGDGFRSGLARLHELGSVRRCAVVAGEQVFHILGPKAVAPASLTRAATQRPDGALTYPALAVKASNINIVTPLTI